MERQYGDPILAYDESVLSVNDRGKSSDTNKDKPTTDNGWSLKKMKVSVIEPAFVMYCLALRAGTTVNEQYINKLVNISVSEQSGMLRDSDVEYFQAEVQSQTAEWVLYCNLARSLPAIPVAFLLCSASDVWGRRPALLAGCAGGMFRFILYITIDCLHLPLGYLILANLLEGLGGSHTMVIAMVYCVLADTFTSAVRVRRFAVIHALLFICSAVSSIAVGYLIIGVGFRGIFCIIAGLFAAAGLYVWLLLAETSPIDPDDHLTLDRITSSLAVTFKIYIKKRDKLPAVVLTEPNLPAVVLTEPKDLQPRPAPYNEKSPILIRPWIHDAKHKYVVIVCV